MGVEIEYPLGCASSGDSLFRDTGRVEVIKRVIFVCRTGDFLDFAKVGPVEWKLGWAVRGVFGNCPGWFLVPVRSCLHIYFHKLVVG